jgi:hypothetical protein
MPTFFSSTDDKYELGDPGIHIVVGAIDLKTRKYQLSASVVSGGRRFLVPYGSIIDTTPIENCLFHDNVLKYVDYTPPKPVYKNTPKTNTYNYNKSTYQQWHSKKFSRKEENESYRDPFYFQDGYHGDSGNYYDDHYFNDVPDSYGGQSVIQQRQPIQLYQVEDILIDFLQQNEDDLLTLTELEESLSGYLNDIREKIESPELIKF